MSNGDKQGLADAMMTLMGNEALRKRMGEEARKVISTYSEETVMSQWIRLFTDLVGK